MKRAVMQFGALFERYWYVFLLLGACASVALSMLMGLHQVVWFDESYSIILAKSPIARLLTLTAADVHPPFYYLFLKAWGGLFGWSELALRSSSAILMAGAVTMSAMCMRRFFSTRAALITLPFVVLAPFVLRYGYEIRMYAMVALIATSATWVLVRAVETRGARWWLIYALLVALGMYTLYMSIVVWLAHGVWLFVTQRPRRIKDIPRMPWVRSVVLAFVLFLPYISIFIEQNESDSLPNVGHPVTLSKLADLYSMLTVYRPDWDTGELWSLVLVACAVLGGALAFRHWGRLPQSAKRYTTLLLCLLLVPITCYALLALWKPTFFVDRYMAHIALFPMMLVGMVAWLGAEARDFWRTSIFVSLSIVALLGGVQHLYEVGNFNFDRLMHPMTTDVRTAAACDHSSTVVVADDPYAYIDALYYFGDCDFRFYAQANSILTGGYAPLAGSSKRITEQTPLDAQRLVHLYIDDGNPAVYVPPTDYKLIQTERFDRQVVMIYQHR